MTKSVYILLLFLGTLFAAPVVLSACETQKKECCAAEKTVQAELSCHTAEAKVSDCHEGRNCCGSKSCRCISLSPVSALPENAVDMTPLRFSTPGKLLFASVTQALAEGFYALFIPPKIV